ncbi:MAG: two-component regulator propeller domain-containing protein [Rhodothermales bacterium]
MQRHPDVLAGWTALLLLGSWAAATPDVLQAQEAAPEAALFRETWRTSDGLPHNAVTALHQTRDGYLWVGTTAGLVRFDGLQFAPVATLQAPQLGYSYIWSLLESRDSTLWVGSSDGLTRLSQGHATTYTTQDGLPANFVRTLALGPRGRLWVGTYGSGLCRYDAEAFTCYGTADGLPDLFVNALWVDRAGTLWVGTDTGVSRWDGSRFVPGSTDTLFQPDVKALLGDAAGTLWLGTGSGLYRMQDGRPEPVLWEGEPLGAGRVLLQDGPDVLWIGTEANGLFRYRDGAFQHIQVGELLSHGDVRALLRDREDILWVGTNGGGLDGLKRARVHTYAAEEGLPSDVVFALHTDRRGQVWIGGQGLGRWTKDGFTTFTDEDGLAIGLIVTMAEAPSGTLWFGSDIGGLSRFENGPFTTFTTADGLPTDAIRALHVDASGALWIGTRGGGLSRFEDGRFTTISTRQGLPDNIIFRILEDDRGYLWMNTGRRGLFRVPKTELEAAMRGEIERVTPLVLGPSDGLRSPEGVGGFHPAGWKARDGRLWFPTHQGGVVVDPDHVETASVPPPVHIERVLVDDDPVPISDGTLTLSPEADRVEIQYPGLSFLDPRGLCFRYLLSGEDAGWVDAGARRSRTYDNLAPGRYTFRVTAVDADGTWSDEPAELAMLVIPPWWRTPWALGLFGLLLGASVYGLVRWRVWQLQRRNAALEALVAARTSQVEAQADALREMDRVKSRFFANLSHEFRTPLTLILGPLGMLLERTPQGEGRLSESPDRDLLRGMRHQSRRLLRLINQPLDLSKLDAGRMPLRARRADLVAFLRRLTASLAETQGVTLDFHTETDWLELAFDPEKLEHVFSNLLSNALKFTPEGGKVQLSLQAGPETADVRVRDTGPGIPEAALPHIFDRFYQAEASGPGGTGIGLALARELVELHGGTIRAESAPGFGSTFTVQLPLALEATSAPPADEAAPDPSDDDLDLDVETDEAVEAETSGPGENAPLVLLVEDNPDVRGFLKQALRTRYRIAEADSGEAGLTQARAAIPDLVISDVMMPEMDGLELCRRLRADERLGATPVILLTARASEESRLEGLGAGADDYLTKPFSAAELLARAENLIEIRRHLRRRFSAEVVVRPTQVTVPSADATFLEQVKDAVEAHLDDRTFGVERLADEVHLSRRQLHRKLRDLTGLSSVGFIRVMRLERATQLLEQRAGTIAEIAYQVGFQDAGYFARLFRQAYGQTPSEYLAGRTAPDPS